MCSRCTARKHEGSLQQSAWHLAREGVLQNRKRFELHSCALLAKPPPLRTHPYLHDMHTNNILCSRHALFATLLPTPGRGRSWEDTVSKVNSHGRGALRSSGGRDSQLQVSRHWSSVAVRRLVRYSGADSHVSSSGPDRCVCISGTDRCASCSGVSCGGAGRCAIIM